MCSHFDTLHIIFRKLHLHQRFSVVLGSGVSLAHLQAGAFLEIQVGIHQVAVKWHQKSALCPLLLSKLDLLLDPGKISLRCLHGVAGSIDIFGPRTRAYKIKLGLRFLAALLQRSEILLLLLIVDSVRSAGFFDSSYWRKAIEPDS